MLAIDVVGKEDGFHFFGLVVVIEKFAQASGQEGDQLRDFLGTQDHGQFASSLRSRNIVEQIASLQRLDIEEAQRGHMLLDRARLQLPLLEEVGLILT